MTKSDGTGQKANKDFERILTKVDRQKTKNSRQMENKINKETARNPYSFTVFRSLRTSHIGLWWGIIGIAVPIPILIMGYNERLNRFIGFGLIAAMVLRMMIHYIGMYLNFLNYKNLFSKMPFQLNGWEELTSLPDFVKFRYWHQAEIRFHFVKNHKVPESVIEALIQLFIIEANKKIYDTIDMPKPKEWKETSPGILEGDVNCRIAGAFYLFLKNELIPFNQKYKIINEMEIYFNKDGFFASVYNIPNYA